MKPEDIVALFAHRAESFARHDTVQLAATHAEDGVLLSPTGGTIVGREAIEKVYRLWFSAFPDLRIDVEDLLIADGRVVQRVTVSGTDCNAGHNPPLLVGRRGIRRLVRGGLILGAFDNAAFEEETLQLDRGDTACGI
jgi:SnoaL-like domain/Stage II sporulation protein E (SpoIIE)